MRIYHTTQVNLTSYPDSPSAQVKHSDWNADHSIDGIRRGVVTFGAADTEQTIALSPAESDASYDVVAGIAGGSATAPFVQVRVKPGSKAMNQFILQVNVAPGGTDTVDVAWILTRD